MLKKMQKYLWQENINVHFVLDPFVATNYCTSYLIEIDNPMTKKIIHACKMFNEDKIETHTNIQKVNCFS